MTKARVKVADRFRWLSGKKSGWQFGEQGVLDAIVWCIKDIPKTCVEFGAGDGTKLPLTVGRLVNNGWRAMLFETDAKKASALGQKYPTSNSVGVRIDKITPQNVGILDGVFEQIGVCVVDVDGDEYPIVNAMKSTPVVFVVEHRDEDDWENPSQPDVPEKLGERTAGGFTYAANLAAVSELLDAKGYTLVWKSRTNGIYVRNDHADAVAREPAKESEGEKLRLNIGGGDVKIPGFVNVDRKNGQEAYPISYPDESVDEIRASHILEHFPQSQEQAIVNEWVRVLKPGGRIRIAVPDGEKLGEMLLGKRSSPINPFAFVYGGQSDGNDYHKNGFNYGGLHVILQRAGLIAIDTWKSDIDGEGAAMPISLNLEGYKPTKGFLEMVQKCHVAMSMPRLWFSDTARCIEQAVTSLGVPAKLGVGAFWGQCLERNMEDIVEEAEASGREWVLTIDYDTAFTQNELAKLLMLAANHPELDAIAPLQPKRNDGTPLINKDEAMSLEESIGPLIPATMAHFGLTLIRISALKKMPHPWFLGVPNKDGKWREGRTDDDVYFWNKFKECGNRLFVASRVSVGHIQLVATWTTEGFGTFHQYLNDFHENGPPEHRRH